MIDVTQSVKTLEGGDFGEEDPNGPATIRSLLINVLVMCQPNEKVDPGEKYIRGKLAEKLHAQDEVEMSEVEIGVVKKLVADAYTNNVLVSRIWDILDPSD